MVEGQLQGLVHMSVSDVREGSSESQGPERGWCLEGRRPGTGRCVVVEGQLQGLV